MGSESSTPAPPFDPEAAVADYARKVLTATESLGLHLLLEPGRFLVAQAGALLTSVVTVKKNGRKTFVITDAGMNDLIRPALYQAHHEILPVRQPTRSRSRPVDIVGPVCESGDFFARDRELPPAQPGDLLAILDAGCLRHEPELQLQHPAPPRRRSWSTDPPHGSSAGAKPTATSSPRNFPDASRTYAHFLVQLNWRSEPNFNVLKILRSFGGRGVYPPPALAQTC